MDIKQRQLVNKYLDLFFRRKIFIIIVLLLSLPIGLGGLSSYPKSISIFVSSQLSTAEDKSKQACHLMCNRQIRDIVNTLSQIVTSRTNLEKIITGF